MAIPLVCAAQFGLATMYIGVGQGIATIKPAPSAAETLTRRQSWPVDSSAGPFHFTSVAGCDMLAGMRHDITTEADSETLVAEYRNAVEQIGQQHTTEGIDEYRRIAKLVRSRWADRQGEDNLHKVCFGEPDE
jgi:hypothetical protein